MNATLEEESLLIRLAQKGDRTSQDRLFHLFYPRIKGYVGGSLRQSSDTEDVVQNIMMRAFQYLPKYRFEAPFSAWLHTIARNEIINLHHKNRRKSESPEEEKINELPAVRDTLNTQEDKIEISATLNKLKPVHAQILALFYLQSRNILEISRILKLKQSATKMRLLRAREAFARQYNG